MAYCTCLLVSAFYGWRSRASSAAATWCCIYELQSQRSKKHLTSKKVGKSSKNQENETKMEKHGDTAKCKTPRWKHQRVGKDSVQENKWKQHGFRKVKTPIHQFQKTHQTPHSPWPLRWRLARGLPPRNGPSTRRGGPGFFPELVLFSVEIGFPNWKRVANFWVSGFFWNIFMESQEIICVWNPSNALPFRISSHRHPSQLGMPSLKGGRWSWNARWGVEFCE